jgi:hypothetical protein
VALAARGEIASAPPKRAEVGANHVDAGANRVDFTLGAIPVDPYDAEIGALRVDLAPKCDPRALLGAPFSVRSGPIAPISNERAANDADRDPFPTPADANRAGVDAIRADAVRAGGVVADGARDATSDPPSGVGVTTSAAARFASAAGSP